MEANQFDHFYNKCFYHIRKVKGKANSCEKCQTPNAKYFWVLLIGRNYSFDPDDYISLCASCRKQYNLTHVAPERWLKLGRVKVNTTEIPKPLPSFPDYVIYSDGTIVHTATNHVLKLAVKKNGYIGVCLLKNGKRKHTGHHRLIAEMFVPNPENKPHVNHINGIKHDNRIGNLEWCTQLENIQHAWRTGLSKLKHQKI